jgi:hypothetical protein
MNNHQRVDAISNAHVGRDFERAVASYLGDTLQSSFSLDIGFTKLKSHRFDLGCAEKKVIVECKSHTWTAGGNVPSAKLTTWDQAMLYFSLAPDCYRKIFAVKHDVRNKSGNAESLADYYIRTHGHVIPGGVEIWELDESSGRFIYVNA